MKGVTFPIISLAVKVIGLKKIAGWVLHCGNE
jgi:hypothetical protein